LIPLKDSDHPMRYDGGLSIQQDLGLISVGMLSRELEICQFYNLKETVTREPKPEPIFTSDLPPVFFDVGIDIWEFSR